MITGNEPITPTTMRQIGDNDFRIATEKDKREGIYLSDLPGLTFRQHFAAMAMQGIMADVNYSPTSDFAGAAERAIKMADALINELNKSK